jgi:esterase
MSTLLNYKLQGSGPAVVLIHGLFGNLDNLGLLARDLAKDHRVLSMDLRNHGLSFHSDEMSYELMAEDVHKLITHLKLDSCILIGHSMGGKVAMKLAGSHPEYINKLIVLDMAPYAYTERKHDNVFDGLRAVLSNPPTNRAQAMALLSEYIVMDGVRQFLGKSLYREGNQMQWRFSVSAIWENYWNILGWEPIAKTDVTTLFLKGADSDYLTHAHQSQVQAQFSNAKAHVIANTGHWLHAEKPQEVIRAIRRFIN